ncbi:MAG: acyl carrier protein [Rhodospirillaceae bacterium]|nr:acyl carrier protein [Rhodospirillaceae bacterium]
MTTNTSENIRAAIITYILENHVSDFDENTIPLDESLVELGVLDSYGVVELVAFLEGEWNTQIKDDEISKEKMGSINKMVALMIEKTNA